MTEQPLALRRSHRGAHAHRAQQLAEVGCIDVGANDPWPAGRAPTPTVCNAPSMRSRGDRLQLRVLLERLVQLTEQRALGLRVADEGSGANRRRRPTGRAVQSPVPGPSRPARRRRSGRRLPRDRSASREVPVQRADPHAGVLGDRFDRRIGPALGEDLSSRRHQALEVPSGVRSHGAELPCSGVVETTSTGAVAVSG